MYDFLPNVRFSSVKNFDFVTIGCLSDFSIPGGDVAIGEGVETGWAGRLTRLSFMVAVKAIVKRGTSALLFRDNCPRGIAWTATFA